MHGRTRSIRACPNIRTDPTERWVCLALSRFPACHSDPAIAGEESLIFSSTPRKVKSQRCFASLNMTSEHDAPNPNA